MQKNKLELVVEKTLSILNAIPFEVKEIASYEIDTLRVIYDYAGITSKSSLPPSEERIRKSVLGYIHKECNSESPRLQRSWEKSLSGTDTFIFIPDSFLSQKIQKKGTK